MNISKHSKGTNHLQTGIKCSLQGEIVSMVNGLEPRPSSHSLSTEEQNTLAEEFIKSVLKPKIERLQLDNETLHSAVQALSTEKELLQHSFDSLKEQRNTECHYYEQHIQEHRAMFDDLKRKYEQLQLNLKYLEDRKSANREKIDNIEGWPGTNEGSRQSIDKGDQMGGNKELFNEYFTSKARAYNTEISKLKAMLATKADLILRQEDEIERLKGRVSIHETESMQPKCQLAFEDISTYLTELLGAIGELMGQFSRNKEDHTNKLHRMQSEVNFNSEIEEVINGIYSQCVSFKDDMHQFVPTLIDGDAHHALNLGLSVQKGLGKCKRAVEMIVKHAELERWSHYTLVTALITLSQEHQAKTTSLKARLERQEEVYQVRIQELEYDFMHNSAQYSPAQFRQLSPNTTSFIDNTSRVSQVVQTPIEWQMFSLSNNESSKYFMTRAQTEFNLIKQELHYFKSEYNKLQREKQLFFPFIETY